MPAISNICAGLLLKKIIALYDNQHTPCSALTTIRLCTEQAFDNRGLFKSFTITALTTDRAVHHASCLNCWVSLCHNHTIPVIATLTPVFASHLFILHQFRLPTLKMPLTGKQPISVLMPASEQRGLRPDCHGVLRSAEIGSVSARFLNRQNSIPTAE